MTVKLLLFSLAFFLSNWALSQTNDVVSYYNIGDYQQVIENTNSLVENDNCDFYCLYYRGLSQQAIYRYKDAVTTFQLAAKQQPDSVYVLMALAYAWEQAGNDDEAMIIYNKILQKDSTHINAKIRLASIYRGDRDYLKATDLYSQLVKKDSTNGYFYSQLAWCTAKLGLTQPATDYYITAWHLNSSDLTSAKGIITELINQKGYD